MNRPRPIQWVPDVLQWCVHSAAPPPHPHGSVWRGHQVLCATLHSCWVGATFPSGMWWQAHLGTPVVNKTNRPPPNPRPPPPHPAPPPPNITRVKVRAGRWDPQSSAAKLWRLQTEQMSTDGGPAAADYQAGNNSGCFDSKLPFGSCMFGKAILVPPQRISAGERCVWRSGRLSSAEVLNVFLSGPDVKLDHRFLLKGRVYWDHFRDHQWTLLRHMLWDCVCALPLQFFNFCCCETSSVHRHHPFTPI